MKRADKIRYMTDVDLANMFCSLMPSECEDCEFKEVYCDLSLMCVKGRNGESDSIYVGDSENYVGGCSLMKWLQSEGEVEFNCAK